MEKIIIFVLEKKGNYPNKDQNFVTEEIYET